MPGTTEGYRDYYSVLQVSELAGLEEIKQAYRRLARQYHPDLNPGDRQAEAHFREIRTAYEVLSDPEKRGQYQSLSQYWHGINRNHNSAHRHPHSQPNFHTTYDAFVDALLGRQHPAPSTPESDSRSSNPPEPSVAQPVTSESEAPDGLVMLHSDATNELTLFLSLSQAFHGTRQTIRVGQSQVEVQIPAGIRAGSWLCVKAVCKRSGEAPQDLWIRIELLPHSLFHFEGDEIVCEVPVTPDEAVLGAQIQVPTLAGTLTVQIPPGSSNGQTLRLKGRGWPLQGQERGNLLVKLQIHVPTQLSRTERECYEKIRANRSFNPRSELPIARL